MANNNALFGAFVPTTNVWDVNQLYDVDVTSPAFKELLVRLYQNINSISTIVNLKDTGYYTTQEFVNGQLYFPNPALNSTTNTVASFRQVFRTVVNFGALPNTTIKSVPHNISINAGYSFTRMYATASDPVGLIYIPIPFADPALPSISLTADATNVNITTGDDKTNYTICYVVLEYIKS